MVAGNIKELLFSNVVCRRVLIKIYSKMIITLQSMTPYMQSSAVKRKVSGKRRLGPKNQGLYAIDLWKNAFKAACERLCPLRGLRKECGCLPMLAKLV